MKKRFNLNSRSYVFLALILVISVISACKKQEYTLTTTDDVNITGYLEKYPDQFSLMSEIIERAGSRGYLSAYGNYTLFTPTNEAVKTWLQTLGKASVSDLSAAELKDVINYHLVMDTLNTKNFSDGKLQQLPLYGQYITTGVKNINNVSTYVLNGEAKVIQSNIRVGNGVLQIIDHVLQPQSKTLAQLFDEEPYRTKYSIFRQALIATGFYDSLNVQPANATDVTRKFQTVFAESDEALSVKYGSYEALYDDLSGKTLKDPKNHSDSLWLYVAYHIGTGANYLADIVSTSSLTTLAPSEVITTKYAGQRVLLNEVDFNGKTEPGVELNRENSDITASNGVLHDATEYFKIKVRIPTPLYWDMELDGLSQNPKHPNYGVKNIDMQTNGASTFPGAYNPEDPTKINSLYQFLNPSNRWYSKMDMISLSISGPTGNKARSFWHEFRTPLLVKGLYKVWVCYAQLDRATNQLQWVMNPGTPNEQVLTNIMYSGLSLTASGKSLTDPNSDNLMETEGYKRYMATTSETAINDKGEVVKGDVAPNSAVMVGRLLGIANIKSTDRQWIRIRGLGGMTGSNIIGVDMLHFIPIDMDQQYPRFSRSGTIFKRP